MQTIETKLARIAAVTKAAGLTEQQARHLIHGTGGSPRRARRAIRAGIHEQLIAAYDAALAEGGSHVQATIACNKLWAELMPATEPADDADAGAEQAAEVADAAVARAKAQPAAAAVTEQPAAAPAAPIAKAKARAKAKAAATVPADVAALRNLLPA